MLGVPGIDVAAPDNPLAAVPPHGRSVTFGSYQPFGGTSGAGPHVAAAAALLRQMFPMETGAQLRARILEHARRDALVADEDSWGAGRLDVAGAFGVEEPAGSNPTLTVMAPSYVQVMHDAVITVNVVDDEPQTSLRMRWDDDYDGTWDTEWVALGERRITAHAVGTLTARVEVRDGQGHTAGAVAVVTVGTEPPPSMGCGCRVGAGYGAGRRGYAYALGSLGVAAAMMGARRKRRAR